MRPALAGLVGTNKAAAGGATAPSTPTIDSAADLALTQTAGFAFTWSSNNGANLTGIELRWSTVVGMTSPTTLTYVNANIRTGSTYGSGSVTAVTSAAAGTYNLATGATGNISGTLPADGAASYYQIRLANSAGASSWSTAYGPITTTTEPG